MLDNPTRGSSSESLVTQMREAREQAAKNPEPDVRPTGGTDGEGVEPEPNDEGLDPDVEPNDPDTDPDDEGIDADPDVDPDAEPEPNPEPQRYRVKIDGEELEVDQDELISGYQRDADYRKKTMELAEQRKAIEAKEAELAQKVQELGSYIEQQDQAIDWDELRDTDPSEYLRQKDLQETRQKAYEEQKEALGKQQQEKWTQRIQQESQALQKVMGPGWTEEKRAKDFKLASEYLASLGVSEQEQNAIADHREWKMIFDAAQYQRLMANKSKVDKQVKRAPQSVKPGQQRQAPSAKAEQEALDKLKRANKTNSKQALVDAMRARRGK